MHINATCKHVVHFSQMFLWQCPEYFNSQESWSLAEWWSICVTNTQTLLMVRSINGHTKMCTILSRQCATDVTNQEGPFHWHADCWVEYYSHGNAIECTSVHSQLPVDSIETRMTTNGAHGHRPCFTTPTLDRSIRLQNLCDWSTQQLELLM